ncbi:MAG: glycosyltransferase [Actinomycetota bacterium]
MSTAWAQHDPERPMRVLEVMGGFPVLSETFVSDQVTALIDRGAEVTVWSYTDPADPVIHERVLEAGLLQRTRYLRLPEGVTDLTGWFGELRRRNGIGPERLDRFDVVHMNFGPTYFGLAPLLAVSSVPLVVSFYGYDLSSFLRAARPGVYEPLIARADLVTANSERGRQVLVGLGFAEERTATLRTGADLTRFAPDLAERRGGGGGPLRVLTIARLVDKKGIDDSLAAVAALGPDVEVEYRIIGDGPLRERLEAEAVRLGVTDRVVFEGRQPASRVLQAVEESDVLLQLSRTAADGDEEGLPIVLTEAAAAGLPIVSTRHAGIPELLHDDVEGFLLDERDVAGAADRLGRLAADPGLRRRLGRGARARAEADYDQVALGDRIHELLVGAVNGAHPRPVQSLPDTAPTTRSIDCPVCDQRVPVTTPGPAVCPSCGSDRLDRTLAAFLVERSGRLVPGATVMAVDVADGLGRALRGALGEGVMVLSRAELLDGPDMTGASVDLVLADTTDPEIAAAVAGHVRSDAWVARIGGAVDDAPGHETVRFPVSACWTAGEVEAAGLADDVEVTVSWHGGRRRALPELDPRVTILLDARSVEPARRDVAVDAALDQTVPATEVVVVTAPGVEPSDRRHGRLRHLTLAERAPVPRSLLDRPAVVRLAGATVLDETALERLLEVGRQAASTDLVVGRPPSAPDAPIPPLRHAVGRDGALIEEGSVVLSYGGASPRLQGALVVECAAPVVRPPVGAATPRSAVRAG